MNVSTDDSTAIRVSVEVPTSPERAYEVFTAGIDTWWERSFHITAGELHHVAVEPWVGGRVWEQGEDQDTCQWGRVTRWEPPTVFAFHWLLGAQFERPAPDAPGSEVTVTFTPTAAGTHVELVHTNLHVHGDDWPQLLLALDSANGWPLLLERFRLGAT